jgi:hypothetical protein
VSTKDAWGAIAARYRQLQSERASEGPGVQLACLVIAEYCAHLWAGTQGGPSLACVAVAEHVLGIHIDEVVAAELEKINTTRENERERRLS